ncbi:hypothetical protein JCGZ_22140 [Jatropha curcas]|uniref:Uncharacterized protein n=1 Tax=Jatropha curcas TaxID=180498 RepID=A0A067LRA4_JATCU|nr:hypothetical protein JCGZ_22140 [Jatropha curcas]
MSHKEPPASRAPKPGKVDRLEKNPVRAESSNAQATTDVNSVIRKKAQQVR